MKRYYLGPWIQYTSEGESYYGPPAGVVGLLDLAPLPVQGQRNSFRPVGLFVTTAAVLPSEYTLLAAGDCRELQATSAMQAAFESLVGHRPQGERLVDLIYDVLTDGSDPDGLDGPKPLMPTTGGWLDLYLGGHSRVLSAKFEWGKPCSRGRNHWRKIQHLIRKEFEKQFDDAKDGKLKDKEHHRRVLDFHCEKYGVADWKEFVPAKLEKDVPGRLKHETTITDNFNRANSTGLGSSSGGWSWTAVVNSGFNINNNMARDASGLSTKRSRAESDLSSADHEAQVDVIVGFTLASRGGGPVCRYNSSADTGYVARLNSDGAASTAKVVAGTSTVIGSGTTHTYSSPDTCKLSVNGSSVERYVNGVLDNTATDTAITGNLRTGIEAQGNANIDLDNFSASDLGGGGAGLLYTQLERQTRGVMRGTFTKWSF